MTANQQRVLNYLKEKGGFISPTQIGRDVGGKAVGVLGQQLNYYRGSSWASPICISLRRKGLAERNDKGHYRFKEMPK